MRRRGPHVGQMKCGSKETKSKAPCGYEIEKCPYARHSGDSAAPERHGAGTRQQSGGVGETPETAAGPAVSERPEAVAERDLRDLAWWTAGALVDGTMEARDVSAMCTLIRTLHALGPEPEDQEAVLKEIELRGVVMNGFPPRNEEEWALAEQVFDADAIAEFHRWEATGHGW